MKEAIRTKLAFKSVSFLFYSFVPFIPPLTDSKTLTLSLREFEEDRAGSIVHKGPNGSTNLL